MQSEQMENTIRRLDSLQQQKIKLVDKYEQVIKNSPLVVNEKGEPQTTVHTAIIALSTDTMRRDKTQAGGYSIVPFSRSSPLLFGYHDGINTGTNIFSLKAVRKIMKSTPSDESLTIITRNITVAEYLKGENNFNPNTDYFPYIAGCIEDIEKMFAERTAPVYGYFLNPEQNVDWMKEFGELARKVASEARKLSLITDDDRQWDEAHQILAPLPLSSGQQVTPQYPRQVAQQDSRQVTQQDPRQDPRQDLQQDLQRAQPSPPPASRRPLGPLGEKAIDTLNKLNITHREKIQIWKHKGGNLGVVCNRDIRLHKSRSSRERNHIAFLAISTDSRKPDGYQFGGYSVVWVDNDCTSNQYNYYDNPDPSIPSLLLLGLRDALRKCPKDEPLLIATTGPNIVSFVNQNKQFKKGNHMESCLAEITYQIEHRKAPTVAFLIGQYPLYTWVKEFYDLARNIASESRKLGSARSISEPAPVKSTSDQLSIQKSESNRPKNQTNVNTESIVKRLRALEIRRLELLESPDKTIEVGDQLIDLNKQPHIRVAIIAMSIDNPREDNGGQVGGFGVVWLDKELGNQFGNYHSFESGALIFCLKAIKELLAECPPDTPLIIGSTNEAIHNLINNVRTKPPRAMHDVDTCVLESEVEDQLRKRKALTRSIMLSKDYCKNPWIKSLYEMTRNVASEARKLWYACREEEMASFTPSRVEENEASSSSSIVPPTKQVREVPVQLPPCPAASSITHPDELDRSLVNQTNQHSLESMHPSRAAAIGLINEQPFTTSVVASNDSNGVQIDRDQVYIPWTQSGQFMNTMPPSSSPIIGITTPAHYYLSDPSAMAHSSNMTAPQAVAYNQYYQNASNTNGYAHRYPGPSDNLSVATDQVTTSMPTLMAPTSIQHEHQDTQYKNKRSISEEDENEVNKRQRIDSSEKNKSEDEGGVMNRIWNSPIGKWMNRMFGRS